MPNPDRNYQFRLSSILRARCPACHQGTVLHYVLAIHSKCSVCGHDFYPEPGFYLGAMMVSFFLTTLFTVPVIIALRVLEVDPIWILITPLLEYVFLGTFLLVYSRVVWLHLEYRMTTHLQGKYESPIKK